MYLAVCEDDKNDLDAVCSLLDAWQAERGANLRRKAFQSAVELLEGGRRERLTLYLLDVMMPEMDGIEAAREIRRFDDAAGIVFLSSSPGFAYESYGVRALTEYVQENGAQSTGPFRSIYLEDPSNRGENSAEYITQVAVPVASAPEADSV